MKKMLLTACLSACMLAGVCYFPVRDMARNVNVDTVADAAQWSGYYIQQDTSQRIGTWTFDGTTMTVNKTASVESGLGYICMKNNDGTNPYQMNYNTGILTWEWGDWQQIGGSWDYSSSIKNYVLNFADGIEKIESRDIQWGHAQFSKDFDGAVGASSSFCEHLTVNGNFREIGYHAFAGCLMEDISIPSSVTMIGDEAFINSEKLTEFTVQKNVTNIGSGAFGKCANLKFITIENPNCKIYDSVKTIYGSYDYDTSVGNYRYNFDGTIYGYAGSTAEAYAKKYGWKFAVIGSTPDTPDTPQTPPLAPAGSYYGDVDGDGEITSADAQNVLMYAVEAMTGNKPSWKAITGNTNAPS